jgi:hypothetical protein
VPIVIWRARLASAAREVERLQRLRSKVHDRSPRLFQAVAQHLPRDVERSSGQIGCALEAAGHRFELQRDPRQPLLERVVELARDARALRQHRLVFTPPAARLRPHPERAESGHEREHQHHDHRVAQRPPRRLGHAPARRRASGRTRRKEGGGPGW